MTNKEKVSIIQNIVCDSMGISVASMLGGSRSRDITIPRHYAICICREMLNGEMTLVEIGTCFGRHYTSVMYAVEVTLDYTRHNKTAAKQYEFLLNEVAYLKDVPSEDAQKPRKRYLQNGIDVILEMSSEIEELKKRIDCLEKRNA